MKLILTLVLLGLGSMAQADPYLQRDLDNLQHKGRMQAAPRSFIQWRESFGITSISGEGDALQIELVDQTGILNNQELILTDMSFHIDGKLEYSDSGLNHKFERTSNGRLVSKIGKIPGIPTANRSENTILLFGNPSALATNGKSVKVDFGVQIISTSNPSTPVEYGWGTATTVLGSGVLTDVRVSWTPVRVYR